MIKNKTIILGLVIIILIGTTFIIKSRDRKDEQDEDNVKIGLSLDSLIIDRWERDRDIFVAKAKELGAEVIVQNCNDDTNEQINQIEYLIDQDVDVLVIVPHDSGALGSVIKSAQNKGIKVISYDRLIRKANVDLYISFDNVKVGEFMAGILVDKVSKGNYLIINGSQADYNTNLVNQGFKNILNPYISADKITIIKEVWADKWREDIAYRAVEEVLSEGTQIDAILAGNDRLAEAAIKALAEKRLAGKVYVAGQDADLVACQSIVEDLQFMTVYKPIRILAQKAAKAAVDLAKGEIVDANDKIDDGNILVPYQKEDAYTVTKKNMMSVVIKDGFHREEEVYRRKK